jgi:hypothetical protein
VKFKNYSCLIFDILMVPRRWRQHVSPKRLILSSQTVWPHVADIEVKVKSARHEDNWRSRCIAARTIADTRWRSVTLSRVLGPCAKLTDGPCRVSEVQGCFLNTIFINTPEKSSVPSQPDTVPLFTAICGRVSRMVVDGNSV